MQRAQKKGWQACCKQYKRSATYSRRKPYVRLPIYVYYTFAKSKHAGRFFSFDFYETGIQFRQVLHLSH